MARPRKVERRDRQLNLSLTSAEYEDIARRAAALGMRPVHFSREILLNSGSESLEAVCESLSTSRLVLVQLTRLGGNLNQMVRDLHHANTKLPADLEPLLDDIRRIILRGVLP